MGGDAKGGDRLVGPWHELEELRPVLRSFVGRRCFDQNDVEDIVQETFLRAARYRRSLVEPARLRSWALRIAGNVLADCIRKDWRLKRAAAGEELVELAASVETDRGDGAPPTLHVGGRRVEMDVALAHLDAALDELREEDRAVLRSYYLGAQSCRTTAAECGIPRALVKVRLFRARERVRRALRRRLALETAPAPSLRVGA